MNSATGTYFDGETLRSREVALDFTADGSLRVHGEGAELVLPLRDIRVSDRLARLPRFLYLPGRVVIETHDNAAVDRALAAQRRGLFTRLIHTLESHSPIATGAAAVIVLVAACAFHFGLPALARHTAVRVPPAIERQAGAVALRAFDQHFPATQLDRLDRVRVETQLRRLLHRTPPSRLPRLEFRAMGMANAFALPGDIIVVSDEFVRLATHDDEIAAVLAHELGHLEKRHATQGVLRSSFALLIVTALTGDLSSLTTFAGTIPWLILNNGYSREFEREADEYAHALMLRRGVRLTYFASILHKMEQSTSASQANPRLRSGYLNTHPATDDRIRIFQPHPPVTAPEPAPAHAAKPGAASPPTPLAQPAVVSDIGVTLEARVADAFLPASVRQERKPYTFPALLAAPKVLHQPLPKYPPELRRQEIPGEVVVDFIVDHGGDTRSIHIVSSSNPLFEKTAIAAIEKWKFRPGRHGRDPANARLSYIIRFAPDPEATPNWTANPPPD